ncbi:MAG TPA: hypothetical protein VE153_34825 [Myxococcus sp.]|nr:hypothetical protein [Myxococcus sp.]
MKKLLCGVALVGGLVGCGGWGRGVEDIEAISLLVLPEKRQVFLYLGMKNDECASISSEVQAELDGMPMVLRNAGESTGLLWSDCISPTFVLEVPEGVASPTLDGLTTSVRLRDGDMERVAETDGLCGERRLRLVTPASGVVRPGELVEVAIEPGTDTLHEPFVAWATDPSGRQEPRYLTPADGLDITPERIRFRAPSGPGPDSVLIRLTGRNPPVLRPRAPVCEGFVECSFDCGVEPLYSPLNLPVRVER